jgi:transketolase
MSSQGGFELGKANLDVFAETLLALAKNNHNVMVVTSDSRGSGKLTSFAAALPDQIIEVGIAEQNLVGVAAGLASTGKIVYAVSPASFLTARSLEQIKNDVCYSDHPVKLIGISGGVSYGPLGSTHHSIHDMAALRAIHNCTIIVPADNLETAEAVKASARMSHPVFIRFGKRPMPHVHRPGTRFEVGKALLVREGNDVAFIANGETVVHALQAAGDMEKEGVSARVISMHTVKPLDTQAVIRAAEECRAIVTVEEHSCAGGLGEACAAILMQAGLRVPFKIVGFPDEEMVTGSQLEIFTHYGISALGLAASAKALLTSRNPSEEATRP